VREELPEPTEIISHILGENEYEEHEEAAGDRIIEVES
jgi:hypothetical protein